MEFSVEMVQQYAPAALADLLDRLTRDLSAAEAERDELGREIKGYKLELDSLREEVERLEADQSPACAARWKEVREERDNLRAEVAEAVREVERLTRVAGPQESNPGPDAPSQERATGAVGSAPSDNDALRQRVFEHLGNLILNEKAGWGGLPDLVAQFDLLGRDL